jgi:hypothetical protein
MDVVRGPEGRFVVAWHPAAGHGGPGSRDVVLDRPGRSNTHTPIGVTDISRGSSEANTPGCRTKHNTCTPRGVRERAAHGHDVGRTGLVGHAGSRGGTMPIQTCFLDLSNDSGRNNGVRTLERFQRPAGRPWNTPRGQRHPPTPRRLRLSASALRTAPMVPVRGRSPRPASSGCGRAWASRTRPRLDRG